MKGWIYPSQDTNSNKSDYSLVIYTRQDTKKEKLSSGEQAPCKWVFSPLGECSRNLSVSVYQLVMLWEAVFGFSEFFWRLFQSICPFHDGWFMSAPIHTTLSVHSVFDQKWYDSHAPPSLSTWSHPKQLLLFPQMNKALKRKLLADVEEMNPKMAEALKKGVKIDGFKNCFKQWKKCLNRCTASNGEYFEGDWNVNM